MATQFRFYDGLNRKFYGDPLMNGYRQLARGTDAELAEKARTMSYRPGYKFQVSSTYATDERGKRTEILPVLYDRPWQHGVEPEENERTVVATLADGEKLEVIEYRNGAVKVRTLAFNLEGWLG